MIYDVPLSLAWSHFLDDRYLEVIYLRIKPANVSQDFNIVSKTTHPDLRLSNFHQIVTARNHGKYIYNWGQLIKFGSGRINDTGNWGLQNQGPNLDHLNLIGSSAVTVRGHITDLATGKLTH